MALLTPEQFHDIISGRRRDLGAVAWRTLFALAEAPYYVAVKWRNRSYDQGNKTQKVAVPVISIGNLTVGGTGKTPMVEWVARFYRQMDIRVSLVSRGYGAEKGALNDEALELEQKLPDVPHVQNPDRIAAATVAIEELATQLIVLDDGFQHRRIHRDVDIVLIDATEPFGYNHLLPRGALREPISGLQRAHAVGLTHSTAVSETRRTEIRSEVEKLQPQAVWFEASHHPRTLLDAEGTETPLDSLRDKKVAAFCGIGNPSMFRATLQHCGMDIADFREFPDHHRYNRMDMESLQQWAKDLPVDAVLCTHKDLVKIGVKQLGGKTLLALAIGIKFHCGQHELEELLRTAAADIEIDCD